MSRAILFFLALIFHTLALTFPDYTNAATYCNSGSGGIGNGYGWELWLSRDIRGSVCITPGDSTTFKVQWSIIHYGFTAQFGRYKVNKMVDSMDTAATATYAHAITATGNVFTGLYGWAEFPRYEFYIIEDWAGSFTPNNPNYMPYGATRVGSISVDNGTYDIWHATPSGGQGQFDQWLSIRTSKRTSGTIAYVQHFKKWRSLGLPNVNLDWIVFLVEPPAGATAGGVYYFDATINLTGGTP